MRISVHENDPGYSPNAGGCKVILNGEEISNCFTADEEQGIAYCYKTDDDGKLLLNEKSEEIITIERKGNVELVLPENFFREQPT